MAKPIYFQIKVAVKQVSAVGYLNGFPLFDKIQVEEMITCDVPYCLGDSPLLSNGK